MPLDQTFSIKLRSIYSNIVTGKSSTKCGWRVIANKYQRKSQRGVEYLVPEQFRR